MSKESNKSLYIVAYVTETKKTEYVYNTDFMTSDKIDQLMKATAYVEHEAGWEFVNDEITESEIQMKLEIA